MGKKLTIEFVKKEFEKEGYTLLSKEYKNNAQKLEYVCPNGHRGSITWSSWNSTSIFKCLECSGNKKKDINFIKFEFAKEKYILLSTVYINNKQKLKYICSAGHKNSITWSDWSRGNRCVDCAGLRKKDINFIRQEFKKEGYQLLSTKYKNAHQKLEYICPKGHISSIAYANFQQGQRCAECAGYKKKDIEFVRQEFEKEGYQLLSTEYTNAKEGLDCICPRNHRKSIAWAKWQQGARCDICSRERVSKRQRQSLETIQQSFRKAGYTLLPFTYLNNKQKLEYICPAGHRGKIAWAKWQGGEKCRICSYIDFRGVGNPNWKNYTKNDIKQFDGYKANVIQITNQNFGKHYYLINPNKFLRNSRQYHLDHIYTIKDGFDNNIPPEIISSPVNLQMLPAKENMKKNYRSDITKETLYDLYHQFEEEIKN